MAADLYIFKPTGRYNVFAIMFILLRYGSRKVHYVLALFNAAAGIWGFGAFLVGLAKTPEAALVLWKLALIGAIFSPILFYHVVVMLGSLKRFPQIALFYSYGIVFCFLTLFDLAGISIAFIPDFVYYVRANDYRWCVLIALWTSIVFYTGAELYRLLIRSSGAQRVQYIYLLIGFAFGFAGALLDALPFFGLDAFPPANIIMCIYSIIVTYAILRHKLLDIEIIIKKTLVFTGLLASVLMMLILPTLLIQEYIFRQASFGGRIIGLTISGIVIILTMRRIEDFLINVTDKYLFQKKYDYKELLKTFTSEVLTVLSLGKLVNLTVDKLDDIMKLHSSAVILLDEYEDRFYVAASRNLKDPSVSLSISDGLVTFLENAHGYFSRKEMAEKKIFVPANIQETIDRLNAELMIPMILQTKMIGILSLGKKKSDEDYTQDDLDILLPLARTLAIAYLANAQLFEQLGKAQAEAAQKEKMAVIGTLSAGINHEICNPLGIARGQCEAFLLNIKDGLYDSKSPEELLEKAKYIMDLVMREVDRATVITKKLSSFAKPAKGLAEAVNINNEIDYVLSLVGHELRLEKIEVHREISSDLPPIFVDRKQFQEVLFNLIRNAGQAIGEKGKITVSARQTRDRVAIDVSDTGSGIPDDKIKELFNPFFTTKGPDKGTGLGLFIVRQVIEKNHGRIYLKETKVGHGTTFTIEFPVMSPETIATSNEEKIKV